MQSQRHAFHLPTDASGKPLIYFCGNSLGLQPRAVDEVLGRELKTWRERGVNGWWEGEEGTWLDYTDRLRPYLADIVGARPEEVITANALTVNLHLMLASFYRPSGRRRKIIMEAAAFPSDQHALISAIRLHGLDPEECLIEVEPKPGEYNLATEAIVSAIERHGEELALVLWGGVQYYTGQFFDLAAIAAAGRGVGARVGFDLAHAVGNVPLELHDWGPDFAVWCSYKYLNGGPGAPGGLFVHERHADDESLPRMAGWWGHRREDRFAMRREFRPERGAAGWQLSTTPVLALAPLLASLPLFEAAGGMRAIRAKSMELTQHLYDALETIPGVTPIVPAARPKRGAQVSVYIEGERPNLEAELAAAGLVCDYRHDNLSGTPGGVLRLAPAPLYNTEAEVLAAPEILARVLL